MISIIRVLGKKFNSHGEALTDAKRFDDHKNFLFGYVQATDDGQSQSVVFIDNREGFPVPNGEDIKVLNCVPGIRLQ